MTSERLSGVSSSSFEELFAKYRPYFVRIAVSYVRDRMAAEDLVTDSFVKVWENRENIGSDRFPAHLYTVLRSRCLNWLRDRSIHLRAQQQLHRSGQRVLLERISRLEATDPQSLLMAEALAIIERELDRMPERRRRIFVAHRYENMSYQEIAALYGLTEGQIIYELRTAKEELKIALKDYLPAVLLFAGHLLR